MAAQKTVAEIAVEEYNLYMQETATSDRRNAYLPFNEMPPMYQEAWIKLVLRIGERYAKGELCSSS